MKFSYIKQVLNFGIVFFILLSVNLHAVASPVDLSQQKRDAYINLAKDIYNNRNNALYRLQVLETLASLEGIDIDIDVNKLKIQSVNKNKDQFISDKDISSKLNYLKDKSYFLGYMLKDLSSSSEPGIKEFSRSILAKLDKKDCLDVFTEMTRSSDPVERRLGINGLARMNSDESVNIMINMLNRATGSEKLLITDALCHFKSKQAYSTALNMIKTENDIKVKINLAVILINNEDMTYTDFLQECCYSDSIDDLRYLAFKLKDIDRPIDFSIIQNLSYKTDPAIKLGLISYFEQNKNICIVNYSKKQLLKILKRYVFDDSNLVRISALKVLANYPDKDINKVIKPLIYDKQLSLTVINLILNTNNKYLLPSVYELSRLDNDQIKLQSAKWLVNYKEKPEKILKFLANNSQDTDIRLSASILLNKLDNTDIYIENIINNNDNEITKEIRNFAVLYLANTKNKNIKYDNLKAIAFDDTNENNSLSAALLLCNNNDSSAVHVLRKFLSKRRPVIISCKYNLENILVTLLEDKNDWVKINSAYNLARINNKKGIEVLRILLANSDDSRIRASAASMLGNSGSLEDIGVLKLAYNDKFCSVRTSAAEAVVEIISRFEPVDNKLN